MSRFAEIDDSGIVQRVIVATQEVIDSGMIRDTAGKWVETSKEGVFRKQYAGIGYKYDKDNDVFVVPQPYPSWSLDGSFDWQPPTAKPDDGKMYEWDEKNTQWVEIQLT